jgi:hypothetical protein
MKRFCLAAGAVLGIALMSAAAPAAIHPRGASIPTAAAGGAATVDQIAGTWTGSDGSQVDVAVSDTAGLYFSGKIRNAELIGPCVLAAGALKWYTVSNATFPPGNTYIGLVAGYSWTVGGSASTCSHDSFTAHFVIVKGGNGTLTMTVTVSGTSLGDTTGATSSTYTRSSAGATPTPPPTTTTTATPTTTTTTTASPGSAPAAKRMGSIQAKISGKGTIVGGGLRCPGTCAATFPIPTRSVDVTKLTLHANPAPGYRLAGWGGVCPGSGIFLGSPAAYRTCKLEVSRDYDTYITSIPGSFLIGYPDGYPKRDGPVHVTARFVKLP